VNEHPSPIDMSVAENVRKAIDLAVASSDPMGWGPCSTLWLHELAGTSTELWTTWQHSDAEGTLIVAITGNGPCSEANAAFFASARKIVLGLVNEVDRLQTALRNNATGDGDHIGQVAANGEDEP
jgi:hypothetical protein